jgi:hypothetical protein
MAHVVEHLPRKQVLSLNSNIVLKKEKERKQKALTGQWR